MSSIQELLLKGASLLKNSPQPPLEAKILLLECLTISEEEIYASPSRKVSRSEERRFYRLISKRLAGIPLPYLTGIKEFWSIPFKISSGVLIPRPETELIVEKVVENSLRIKEMIVDVGTGCGNIAVALGKELPLANIVATDVSSKALKIAELNANQQRISNIVFVRGSIFSPLKKLGLEGKCDFIVSNPPYVSEEEWARLPQEIRDYEPKKALVAGERGLEVISQLIKEAPTYLKPDGCLLLEIGDGQLEEVISFFKSGWKKIEFFPDLYGIDRVIFGRRDRVRPS